jgi:hypothetical protein
MALALAEKLNLANPPLKWKLQSDTPQIPDKAKIKNSAHCAIEDTVGEVHLIIGDRDGETRLLCYGLIPRVDDSIPLNEGFCHNSDRLDIPCNLDEWDTVADQIVRDFIPLYLKEFDVMSTQVSLRKMKLQRLRKQKEEILKTLGVEEPDMFKDSLERICFEEIEVRQDSRESCLVIKKISHKKLIKLLKLLKKN